MLLTRFLGEGCVESGLDLSDPVIEGFDTQLEALQHAGKFIEGVAIAQHVTRRRTQTQVVDVVHTDQLP